MRIRTGYSFRSAFGMIEDAMSALIDAGYEAAPISDRMSTFGFNRWTKLCAKKGIRPIYGVEIPCAAIFGEKKPTVDYWTFFAVDSLRPLHDLIWLATNNVSKEPSLLYAQALRAEGVVAIAGERLQVDSLPQGLPLPYLALSPSTPKGLVRRAVDRGVPLVASCDNYYPRAADLETYRVALGHRSGTQTYPRHIMSDHEWSEWMGEEGFAPEMLADAVANRDKLMDGCRATMRKAKLLSPAKEKTLLQMCLDGALVLGVDMLDPVYSARLDRELGVIVEKDFEDYFYILADLIQWAKARMVVGPARGSSCGSLVCYLLGITSIDPIPYDLIFERFIDINRADLPDVDVDFSDVNRHLVFTYAEERYGKERVARLGTVGMFKAQSAFNQVGKVLKIPKWKMDKVSETIVTRSAGDARALMAVEDTLALTEAGRSLLKEHPEISVAMLLEGHPDVASQHAAGLLLTDEPITEYVAMDARKRAAWCDKKDAEDLNLLKIDALGLVQLSIFERTLELIGEKPISGWLEQIPLDDAAAFAVLNRRHFSGIFQVTGQAVRGLAEKIHFENLNDLVALGALGRPGPMQSGGAATWIKRRAGEPWQEHPHPLLAELTRETYGVIIYQETVMRIVRELGGFSWSDTSKVRKMMSSTQGDEAFAVWWPMFRDGAKANDMSEHDAQAVWDQIRSFGSWAFNKSHSVAYGVISYWCAWLKAHHPLAFAAATLDAEKDPAKQIETLRELAAEGVSYVAVDPDRSVDRWAIDGKRLIGPLTAIKGIGPAKVREIIDCRSSGKEIRPALKKQLEGAKTEIDTLFPVADAVKRLHPDLAAIKIFSDPVPVEMVQPGIRGDVMVFALITRIAIKDENAPEMIEKRNGRRITGPDQGVNIFARDDSGEIFCKIDRRDYAALAPAFLDRAKAGKSIYAIKGQCPQGFRMISIKAIRYLGDLS